MEIATDLDVSVAVAGQLATATFAAWAVSLICVGPLSDSFGRRPVALTGLVILSVSVLASAFAPNIEALLALRMLTGLAGGTLPPTAVGVVSDVISPARRALAVTALLAMNGVVSGITVPMVAVLADLGGWRLPFVVAGMVLALGLLANWIWFPKDSRERVRSFVFFSRYMSLLSLRFFRVAIAVGMTQRIAFWATLSFFPAHLILAYDVPLGLVALPLVITAAGSNCRRLFRRVRGQNEIPGRPDRRHFGRGRGLRVPVLLVAPGALDRGGGGHGGNWFAERGDAGAGGGQHRVFR